MFTKRIIASLVLLVLVMCGTAFGNKTFAQTPSPTAALQQLEESQTELDSSVQAEPSPSNQALEVLKERQEKIQETFETSEIKKEEAQAQSELENVQLEKKTLEEINAEIQSEVDRLKEELDQQAALAESLQSAQAENAAVQEEMKELESVKNALQRELETKNILLEKNTEQIQVLEQEEDLKEYALQQNMKLQRALQEKENEEASQKLKVFSITSAVFAILYILRFLLAKKVMDTRVNKKKYAHKFAAFDVLSLFGYLGFLVWFLFYIKPEIVVYLLFLVGAIVIVLQEYIFSIISSIFILQTYQVGSRIRFEKGEGIIEGMSLLKVSIRTIDSLGTNMQEVRIIPNSQFMKKEVTILSKNEIEKASFKIILPNDLSINEPMFAKHIEENVLQKNITVKSINEITDTEHFYEIDFSFMPTGQPVIEIFWSETREKSKRIKRKILAELENFKKASEQEKMQETPEPKEECEE